MEKQDASEHEGERLKRAMALSQWRASVVVDEKGRDLPLEQLLGAIYFQGFRDAIDKA